ALGCRNNGTDNTRDHTMDVMRGLDIGYGYTADGGKTHPFRGKGVGLMPSLDEVLAAFPTESLLIHIKSSDADEGAALADRLAEEDRERLTVYGGGEPIAALRERLPDVRAVAKQILVAWLARDVVEIARGA